MSVKNWSIEDLEYVTEDLEAFPASAICEDIIDEVDGMTAEYLGVFSTLQVTVQERLGDLEQDLANAENDWQEAQYPA